MNQMKRIMTLFAMAMLMLTLSACAEEEKDKITLGEGDWDSNAFHDQMAKYIIEKGYGIEVDIVMADTAVMVTGMKNGSIDAVLELWSDNIPTYQDDLEKGDYIALSVNFDDNAQGLYVPRYVVEGDNAVAPDLKTVEDLKEYAELFEDPENPGMGIIYGGPEGWSATEALHNKMSAYDLESYYNFKPIDSGATLSATLASAYEKGEPWVGYSWEPTWIMGIYDMVLLEDSEYNESDFEAGIGAFPTVEVVVAGTKEFVEKHPEVSDFLKNYKTSSAITNQALAYMQENEVEADVAAVWFLKENEQLWKTWVPNQVYEKVIKSLEKE